MNNQQQQQQVGSGGVNKDPDEESVSQSLEIVAKAAGSSGDGSEKAEPVSSSEEESAEKPDDPMEEDSVSPATVFNIRLKQPRSNLQHKMSVPELCRNFRYVYIYMYICFYFFIESKFFFPFFLNLSELCSCSGSHGEFKGVVLRWNFCGMLNVFSLRCCSYWFS